MQESGLSRNWPLVAVAAFKLLLLLTLVVTTVAVWVRAKKEEADRKARPAPAARPAWHLKWPGGTGR